MCKADPPKFVPVYSAAGVAMRASCGGYVRGPDGTVWHERPLSDAQCQEYGTLYGVKHGLQPPPMGAVPSMLHRQ